MRIAIGAVLTTLTVATAGCSSASPSAEPAPTGSASPTASKSPSAKPSVTPTTQSARPTPTPPKAPATEPISWWIHYPFAVPEAEVISFSATEFNGPRENLELPNGAGSKYETRRLEWRDWGSGGSAVATGQVRYCGDACEPWQDARIELRTPTMATCGHGVENGRFYATVRLTGFPFIANGTEFENGHPPC